MNRKLIAIVAGLGLAGGLLAGTVKLKDGTTVEGDLRPVEQGWEITQKDGHTRVISADEVVSIKTTASSPGDPKEASERLASLRRTTEAMSDLGQIIQRYELLIKQIGATPAAEEAKADLAKWKVYQEKGMLKIAKEWKSPEEVAELDERMLAEVEKARDLVKRSQYKDAGATIDKVLAGDPTNVGALYLKGLVAFRQDQIPVARKTYDQLAALMPGHGPTLNNLAVAQWRQNAMTIAMGNLQKAMVLMPLNVGIHDNVAEMLALPQKESRDSATKKRLQAQFQADEPRLAAEMAKGGWYRWGSTWVTEDQLRDLKQQQAEVQTKLDELSRSFESTQRGVRQIDDDLEADRRSLTSIENSSTIRDDQGRTVRTAYPSSYYDTQRDIEKLESRKKRELAKLETLRQQAEEAKSKMTVPPYSGKLKMLDETFTPTRLRATTRPAGAAEPGMPAEPVKAEPAEPMAK